ncbi:MAG TPA: glutathione S-transferase family protein [Allosphingosinicella sp.]
MALTLYAHPFSSYCQKVLIALWENDLPFTYKVIGEEPGLAEEHRALWPFGKFPTLVDDGQTVAETSIIIEHLGLKHPGPVSLVPADPEAALEVRFLDRVFDNYVMTPTQQAVGTVLRGGGTREEAMAIAMPGLETAYAWLEDHLAGRTWAAGDSFTLADCAAAPSLFYADWVHQIDDARFPTLRAYRSRLLARPSVARAVDGGRPYRHYFPLGAPDRD